MSTHRILQWWKDVPLGDGVQFHLVPPQTYEEVGKELFDAIVEQVKKSGCSYRVTEQTMLEIERSRASQ